MESERPHRTTSTNGSSTSELFICFTSRLSSSSMKLSKSILSPGRAREPSQISLSSSLSRRLRSSGSMKGGQASPMFPTGGKKRGYGFENPEPSSPKVTCIGQVRVKTKRHGKKMRTRSKRRGEASFRRVEQQNASVVTHEELNTQNNANGQFQSHQILQHQQHEGLPHRNQRWVHLPVTICEALRAFGAELNCFLPCRSSCMTSEREKEEKAARSDGGECGNGSSCGAVFARWLVAMQEGEGKGREIELVVREEERVTERNPSQRRREVFDAGFEIDEQRKEVADAEEDEARVSICIPPKNALLLMRCRSDPVKMAAMANRFWDSPIRKDVDEDYDQEEDEGHKDKEQQHGEVEVGEGQEGKVEVETEEKEDEIRDKWVSAGEGHGHLEEKANFVTEEQDEGVEENSERSPQVINQLHEHPLEQEEYDDDDDEEEEDDEDEEEEEEEEELELNQVGPAEETLLSSPPGALADPENSKMEPKAEAEAGHQEQEAEDDKGASFSPSSVISAESGQESEAQEEQRDAKPAALGEEAEESNEEKEMPERPWEGPSHGRPEPEYPIPNEHNSGFEPNIQEIQQKPERGSSVLPDCLLLMMCEPKLSMEVSKETWVCSTDFIRCLPERPANKTNGEDEVKKPVSTEVSNPTHPPHQLLLQPPRSSCSFPIAAAAPGAGSSMASMIEQKLVGSNGYEPFVLTRCKSEPRRSSGKFTPEACFWKNRKMEPHRPATLGVGTAGIGF